MHPELFMIGSGRSQTLGWWCATLALGRLSGGLCALVSLIPLRQKCQTSFSGALACSARKSVSTTVVASSGKKIDISKQGLNSIENEVVKLNLMGRSKSMESKEWRDSQGRKGKVSTRPAHAVAASGATTAICF
jgi:hypothetical protein